MRHLFVALLLSAALLAPLAPSHAQPAPKNAEPAAKAAPSAVFTDKQRAAIDAAIKAYIMDNPQILISSVEAYYNTQAETKKVQEGPITQFPAGLLDYPGTPTVGPDDAQVSVVEFFDYNCGYCKQVANDVDRLINEEKNVRVIFKELPILSETSEEASRYALAADKQGKYLEYHKALMNHQGSINEDVLTKTAKDIGLNVEQLKKDANTQDIRDQLAKNVELARELGVRGTPFFVIGRQKIPGALGFTKMKEALVQERGDAPAPAAAATPSTTTGAAAPAAADADKPATPPVRTITSSDPETQAELDNARSEAEAMINEIKAEAEKMQQKALELQKQAEEQKAAETPAKK